MGKRPACDLRLRHCRSRRCCRDGHNRDIALMTNEAKLPCAKGLPASRGNQSEVGLVVQAGQALAQGSKRVSAVAPARED